MNEPIILFNMTWANIIALGASVVSLLAVIASLIIGVINANNISKNNKENNFSLNVTIERNKWLERLRQDISKFCGLTMFFVKTIRDNTGNESKDILKEIDSLRYMIKLRLNPTESIPQQIINLLDEIPKLTDLPELTQIENNIDALIDLSQKLLKEEWEKVKKESHMGYNNSKKENRWWNKCIKSVQKLNRK